MVFISDNYNIKDSVEITPNGFALFQDVKIANSGNVQVYKNFELSDLPEALAFKDELRIYRPADEVKKSVDNFNYLTVTNGHPWENVDSGNFKEYSIGISSDSKFKKDHVVSRSILVTDSAMIVMLQANSESKELSCGYFADFVYEAGTTEKGEPYDGYMKNLKGNHIAIVERGRCGGTCRLWE